MKKLVILVLIFVTIAGGIRYYIEYQSHEPIIQALNDPDSAKFRNERFIGGWTLSGVMCGEVNAKNRLGGYIGYTSYYTVLSGGIPTYSRVVTPGDSSGESGFKDACVDQKYWSNVWWWLYW